MIKTTLLILLALAPQDRRTWTGPARAAAEDPDFNLQGEYESAKGGLQVVALGGGRFLVSTLKGGLPGNGWDARTVSAAVKDTAAVKELLSEGGYKKVERKSPTLGKKPPPGAVVLFDGTAAEWKKGRVTPDGLLMEGTQTQRKFGDFQLHLEFRMPYKPGAAPGSQDRGNSGLYIFNRYETQILDSFGLHYSHLPKNAWRQQFEKDLGARPRSDRSQWGSCFYKFKTPDVNALYPPLTWQTYDITFTAPRFDGEKKTANARITVLVNGVKVHDDVELPKGTGAGGGRKEVAREGLVLQGHGNPVRFRNIWLVEKK